MPANLQTPGSTIDTTGWGTPSAAYPSSTCNISNYFTAQKVCVAYGFTFTTDTHEHPQLVLDITLCGDWAGVPSVYNATCSGGTTGVCVSSLVLSVNGRFTPFMHSTPIMLLGQAVLDTIMLTSRSITFACTSSMHSPHPFQALCIIPALVARPSRRAPVPALAVDQIPVVYSTSHLLSTCLFCCLSAPLPFSFKLFKATDRRRRTCFACIFTDFLPDSSHPRTSIYLRPEHTLLIFIPTTGKLCFVRLSCLACEVPFNYPPTPLYLFGLVVPATTMMY